MEKMDEQDTPPVTTTTEAVVAAATGDAGTTTTTTTPAETAAAVAAAAAVTEDEKPPPPTASAEAMETVRQQFQALEGEPEIDTTKGAPASSIVQQQLVCIHCQTVRKETSPVALAKHLILCYKTPVDLKTTVLSGHSMFREVTLAGALAGMGPTQSSSKVSVAASIHLKVEEGNSMGNIVQTCSFCNLTWAAPQFLQSKWDTHVLEQCPSTYGI